MSIITTDQAEIQQREHMTRSIETATMARHSPQVQAGQIHTEDKDR